ncbi:Oligosaccharide translocation protein rft1 [Thoreauomyces humboldtii]|nr:Oligosaccharide translocation protein rft1 [Thoreauomyces humboldtii]
MFEAWKVAPLRRVRVCALSLLALPQQPKPVSFFALGDMQRAGRGTHIAKDSVAGSPSGSDVRGAKNHQGSATVAPSALSSSIKGAGYLFLLQLCSRGATFFLNNYVQRTSSMGTVGIASELELLSGTILFLSRENLRMALLRVSSGGDEGKDTTNAKATAERQAQQQKLVNLSYLTVAMGMLLTLGFAVYAQLAPSGRPHTAVQIYLLATAVELLSEPMYLLVQNALMYDARAKVEGSALMAKCFTTFAFTLATCSDIGSLSQTCGVHAYALGQLAYALVLLVGYFRVLHGLPASSLPRASIIGVLTLRPVRVNHDTQRMSYFDPYLLSLAWSFAAQSGLKYILTEGDRLVLLWMGRGDDEKGAYRMVSDLGSLIARIVFQPIEEVARAFFSKSLAGAASPSAAESSSSLDLLTTLLRFHLFLGSYFVFLAPNYSGTLISLLYGAEKAAIPEIVLALSVYCLYVPLMGINGITEGFVQGVGNTTILRAQSMWMVVCSAVFAVTAYVAMEWLEMGSAGLVVANMANMVMRIGFCAVCIGRYFGIRGQEGEGLSGLSTRLGGQVGNLLPGGPGVWAALLASWVGTRTYANVYGWATWTIKAGHVVLGGACAVVVTGLM